VLPQAPRSQATGPNFLLDWRNWVEVIVNIALVFNVISWFFAQVEGGIRRGTFFQTDA